VVVVVLPLPLLLLCAMSVAQKGVTANQTCSSSS
jgi:hypothetical protein